MPEESSDFFLSEGPLKASDASVALMLLEDSRYLMQLRDQKSGIFFPGHWGLFGGAIDPGETPESALRRELMEELGFEADAISYFTRFSFDLRPMGSQIVDRTYYEVKVPLSKLKTLRLGEGAAMRAFSGPDLLANLRVTPYDSFAIWMHLARGANA